jgi:hypothetical protein
MIPLSLFAAAFLVRLVVGSVFAGPAYPDSYYYVNVAQQLASGNGFQVDYIWSFIDVGGRIPDSPALPIPSNAHWMPLASLVQVPFIWLFGPTPIAYGLPFWIVGALAAPLTWSIGRDAHLGVRVSAAAGAMVAVPGALMPFVTQPDNFGLFMVLGPLALWLCARGIGGDRRAFVVGGIVVALATLARNDGVLLGVPFALAALVDLLRAPANRRIGLGAAVGCAALFVLVTAPWLVRQLDVFGTLSPSAASGRILWILHYEQLHSVAEPLPGPSSLLEQGVGALIASRLGGLFWAVGLFALMPLVLVLTPFAVIGAWVKRRDRAFIPFLLYAGLLFALSGLLFAVHVPYGTFIHSAVALLPHTYLLVAIGIGVMARRVARHRRTWEAPSATMFFTTGAVLLVVLGAGLQTARTTARWEEVQSVQRQLAGGFTAAPQERLMSVDAGAYRFVGGHSGVVTPNDPLDTIEQGARAYNIRWLALESSSIVPALAPVLRGDERPAWLSEPVLTVLDPTSPVPRGALYALCLTPTDERCPP